MRSFFALVALISSTCAYQILTPGNSNGWTTAGPNIVTWQRVVTDSQTFTILLVNQNQGVLSGGLEILAVLVNSSALTYTVPPPSGGFPVGTGFQVNFVPDAGSFSAIFAQSGQFAITGPSSTNSPSRAVASATPANPATVAATTDTSGALNPTGTSTSSRNSADRIAAAGSTALLFAALTVFIL